LFAASISVVSTPLRMISAMAARSTSSGKWALGGTRRIRSRRSSLGVVSSGPCTVTPTTIASVARFANTFVSQQWAVSLERVSIPTPSLLLHDTGWIGLDGTARASGQTAGQRHYLVWAGFRRKLMDIFEGTEQIQELVISRAISGLRIE